LWAGILEHGIDLRSRAAGGTMGSTRIDAALTPPGPFSALLFDCDGTLVDSVTAYERAWERAFAAQGRTMDPEWYRARTGLSPAALADAAALDDPTPLDKQAVQAEATRHFVDLVELVTSNERVVAVAHAHHEKVPMAVVSGGPRAGVQASLGAAGILGLFDAVVTVEDVERGKPAPDLYLVALDRLQVDPGDCVAYEDTDEGLAAATAAGIRCIDVRPVLAAGLDPSDRRGGGTD
jgi:beta-phosphoglucomutase-like phosphatase (HAD superfamily)